MPIIELPPQDTSDCEALRLALGPKFGPEDDIDLVDLFADGNDFAAILRLFDLDALTDPTSIDDRARGWVDFAMRMAVDTEQVK